jgi:hypothetical protein
LDIVVFDPRGTRCGLSISTGVYFDQRLLAEKHLFLGSLTLEIELNKIRNLHRQFFIGFGAKPPWLAEPIPRGRMGV